MGRFFITDDGNESFRNKRSDPKPFILTFDNYGTGETYPLCVDPQCQHDVPTCSAYFPLAAGQPECFYYDGAYLYFYLGGEEALYRQRLDGTERKLIPWHFVSNEQEHDIIAESGDFFIVRNSGTDYRIPKEEYYRGNARLE